MKTIEFRPLRGETLNAVIDDLPWRFSYSPCDGLHFSVPHNSNGMSRKCSWENWLAFSGYLIPYLLFNSSECKLLLSSEREVK
jgi:hypothetical protein